MFFGISAQNDAEWWSSCPKLIDFRISFFDLKLDASREIAKFCGPHISDDFLVFFLFESII